MHIQAFYALNMDDLEKLGINPLAIRKMLLIAIQSECECAVICCCEANKSVWIDKSLSKYPCKPLEMTSLLAALFQMKIVFAFAKSPGQEGVGETPPQVRIIIKAVDNGAPCTSMRPHVHFMLPSHASPLPCP